jgi:DegV family protein with EDD domain
MRIGIVTDATCDLPGDFIKANDIEILPVTVRVGDQVFVDERDFDTSMLFYKEHWGDKFHDAETAPFTVEQIQEVFLSRLIKKYDYVFCVTVWKDRSKIFENATKAAFAILRENRKIRAEAGIKGPFTMRVIDSNALGPGIGLVVAEIAKLIREGVAHDVIRQRVDNIANTACTLLAINDLSVVRARASKRGEKSIGLGAFLLASALDIKPVMRRFQGVNEPIERQRGFDKSADRMLEIACDQIGHRITSSHVVVAYGGNPEEVHQFPNYKRLRDICELKGLELLTAVSSMSLSVNIGQGGLGVAWGTDAWQQL